MGSACHVRAAGGFLSDTRRSLPPALASAPIARPSSSSTTPPPPRTSRRRRSWPRSGPRPLRPAPATFGPGSTGSSSTAPSTGRCQAAAGRSDNRRGGAGTRRLDGSLLGALAALPPDHRAVIVLRYLLVARRDRRAPRRAARHRQLAPATRARCARSRCEETRRSGSSPERARRAHAHVGGRLGGVRGARAAAAPPFVEAARGGAAALVVLAGLLSPPGRAVLDEIREVVGVEESAPALFSLPARVGCSYRRTQVGGGAGRLGGCWDRTARRRGRPSAASSSRRGRTFVALTPGGTVRWSLARPKRAPAALGGLEPTRGSRISPGRVRVVGGDGMGDHLLDAQAADRRPSTIRPRPPARVRSQRRLRPDHRRRHRRGARPRRRVPPRDRARLARWTAFWRVVGWADAVARLHAARPAQQVRAVSDVSAQFRSRSFPTIAGWCCPP